jgi:hypothetical protein
MRFTVIFCMAFCIVLVCRAQQGRYTAFTVNDGLPSNYVYRCIEDDKGFLWVATDAGVARFDGRRFQVFTTKDGLPDNEVLEIVKENNGRIWVSCFKKSPAWFDEVKNRFINADEDTSLAKINAYATYRYLYTLPGGGVMYYTGEGSYIIRQNKLVALEGSNYGNFLVREEANGTMLTWANAHITSSAGVYVSKLYQLKNGRAVDSVTLTNGDANSYSVPSIHNGVLFTYCIHKNLCYVYSQLGTAPLRYHKDSIRFTETCFFYGFTGNWLVFYGNSGKMYVYNSTTLQPLFTMQGNYAPNGLFKDSKGNIWVSTVDKGLILYKNEQVGHLPMPEGFANTSFLSLALGNNGTVLAGNFNGEVLQHTGQKAAVHQVATLIKGIVRIRKILLSQNKVFTVSEGGINVNYTHLLTLPNTRLLYGKTAINYNDSIIIVGNVGSLYKINTVTLQTTLLHNFGKRVTSLATAPGGTVYFSSIDGLYKYHYPTNIAHAVAPGNAVLANRITGICTTANELLWAATADNGVGIVNADTLLYHVTEQDGISSNSVRSIVAGAPGQVWLGTGKGISIIKYKLVNGRVNCTVQNLSVNDGLTSNVVNEMAFSNDTVYAATAAGISVIPANIFIPPFNIPVQLTGVSINQRDTVIANTYHLGYGQRSIQLKMAGIELNGHFKNLQYSLDGNQPWTALDDNTLTIQLTSGSHTIQVRAVDVNGYISNKILTVRFTVATPFWQSVWFWALTAAALQGIAFYFVSRRHKKRREAALAKKIAVVHTAALEQQAFTALMNPHFMFNALNSIQHYINLQDRQNANRYLSDFASLIRKSFEASQKYFITLEQEMENIKIYLRLEQMRFNGRFEYEVITGPEVDTDDWMIPTMVLQPFLENALLHGIMPSTIHGRVVIACNVQHNSLVITITDNGIGIANSRALNAKSTHKSLGMELIEKRIAALGRFCTPSISITILPACNDATNPGTTVTLVIPADMHEAWQQAQHNK